MTEEEAGEDERAIELESISAIFPELLVDPSKPYVATLEVEVAPTNPLTIGFKPLLDSVAGLTLGAPPSQESNGNLQTFTFSHLPPLHLSIILPNGYPEETPPIFKVTVKPGWIPNTVAQRLVDKGEALWEEFGRSQVVYAYIDFLQQEVEHAFGLENGGLVLNDGMKDDMVSYDKAVKRRKFEEGTFACGICLEPKKGAMCYRLRHCGHVFCVQCLQDFFNNAITEGDVSSVKCMDFGCGKQKGAQGPSKPRLLHPTELLEIPLQLKQVRRYVDMKLKKMLESDPDTVYCPREWCQGPARSKKYARFQTHDLSTFPEDSDDDDKDDKDKEEATTGLIIKERLARCSKCSFAFCCVCLKGWHGDYLACRPPRPVGTMSDEEKASIEFIRLHTSPCPTCNSPTQKKEGCNHMICAKCNTHYCYLCSSWLNKDHPYHHFNTYGTPCYYKLFDLAEGDDGNEHAGVFAGARGFELDFVADPGQVPESD
ncbi:MAG: translation termination inhibitor protein itt1 [Chrysothrix sp. TS-e1954]|nr:MAG: translation termination inhibitor protein itt1 [Chrysothrix sp. TS-e1954]